LEGSGVDDVARVVAAAEAAGGADCQRAGIDSGDSAVGVVSIEREDSRAGFGEAKAGGREIMRTAIASPRAATYRLETREVFIGLAGLGMWDAR
jgi:hypothetical protein